MITRIGAGCGNRTHLFDMERRHIPSLTNPRRGAHERNRTSDLFLTKELLYHAELHGQNTTKLLPTTAHCPRLVYACTKPRYNGHRLWSG